MKAILTRAALAGTVIALSWTAIGSAAAEDDTAMSGDPSMMQMMTGAGPGDGMGMMGHGPMMDGAMGTGGCRGMGLGDSRMGFATISGLPDLTEKQSEELRSRDQTLRRELWKLGGEAMDAQFKLDDLTRQDRPAPKAVGEAMSALFDVHRRMVEARIAALNDAQDVLTNEQRKELKRMGGATGMGMDMRDHNWMGTGGGMMMRHR